MPRILGVDIPKDKRIEISLTYLYGLGRTTANRILKEVNISPDKRAKDLSDEEVARITAALQKSGLKLEGDLRREIAQNIKRLIDIGSWRYVVNVHAQMPVRAKVRVKAEWRLSKRQSQQRQAQNLLNRKV